MKQYVKRVEAILVICTSFAVAGITQAQDSASPPTNMPFRYGLGYDQFQEHCAQCHGPSLEGTNEGPPLVHGYYVPSHHDDTAFYRAIRRGTKQHHWTFGDMAPVAGVEDNEVRAIVEFVRWYQQESGLF